MTEPICEEASSFLNPNSYKKNVSTLEISEAEIRKLSDVPSYVIIRKRIRYGSAWRACQGLFLDYSRSTTVHGLRYIFSLHRPLYEKLYWSVLTLISFNIAVYLMWNTYLKWNDSPVILGFDETLVPVHYIPFPTVTICPEIKMEKTLFDFSKVSQRLWNESKGQKGFQGFQHFTKEELDFLAATLHICEEEVANRFASFIPSTVQPNIAQILVDLSLSKNRTAPFCKWNGRFYFCENLFTLVATDEGICYQFNALEPKDTYRNVSDLFYYDSEVTDFRYDFDKLEPLNNLTGYWSLESGYVEQGFNSYPQRTTFAKTRNAFFAILQGFQHNVEYACRNYQQGYRIFLNSPESLPLPFNNYILVSHGDEVLISVRPHYIIGHKDLLEYSPDIRQCFFNKERYLRYFLYYSQTNCQTECLVNFTIARCGCAKFWMPRPFNVSVCGARDMNCYRKAYKELNLRLQNQTFQQRNDLHLKVMCDCMPSCTSLEYHVEISSAAFNMAKTLEAFREHETTDFFASRLSVYFKEHQFTAIKRTVFFSATTFFANCGGIFGLFMGISGLSIIEFLYFFSVRLVANLRKRRFSKKRMAENSLDMRIKQKI